MWKSWLEIYEMKLISFWIIKIYYLKIKYQLKMLSFLPNCKHVKQKQNKKFQLYE